MKPLDQQLNKNKKKVMDQIHEKISTQKQIDNNLNDQELFDKIITGLREDKIAPLTGLERMLGRPATRDDFKDQSYDYDTWSRFFADTRQEKTYQEIRSAIFDIYKSKIGNIIDPQDKASQKAYQQWLSQIPSSHDPEQFAKTLIILTDLIEEKKIKLKKGQKIGHIMISNAELEQTLIDYKLIQKDIHTDYIHTINQITNRSPMQKLQNAINKQIKESAKSVSHTANHIADKVESCFVLPSLGAVVDSYNISSDHVVQGYLDSGVTIEDIINQYPPHAQILPIVQTYQKTHDISTLDHQSKNELYMRIYEQMNPSQYLQGTVRHIINIDPLVGSALSYIVSNQNTEGLNRDQKQAILDKMKHIRLTPKTQKYLNELLDLNPLQYQKFVDQILDLQCMNVSLDDIKNGGHMLHFKSKNLVINNPQTIGSVQDLQDINLDFTCSMGEDFEYIYRNRFVGSRLYGRHHKPAFFPWKGQELHEGDTISIKGPDGKVYIGYPQLTQSADITQLKKQAQIGNIDRNIVNQYVTLDLYQTPPSVSPRQKILSIPSTDVDIYQFDTSSQATFQREFHLSGSHDLKGLFLLMPMFKQADKLSAEDIAHLSSQYKGQSFVSRFHRDQESDRNMIDNQDPEMTEIMSAYDHLSQANNPAHTLKQYLISQGDSTNNKQALGYLLYALDHHLLYPNGILLHDGRRVKKILSHTQAEDFSTNLQKLQDAYDHHPDDQTLHALHTAEANYIRNALDHTTDLKSVLKTYKSRLEKAIHKYQVPTEHNIQDGKTIGIGASSEPLNEHEHFLKAWGALGGDQAMQEPAVGDSLYFAHGESDLPKLQGYAFNGEGTIGRAHNFWTKFEITEINIQKGTISGKITGVEQTLGSTEGKTMEIQMTAQALSKLQKNFPNGIIKIPKIGKKDTFSKLIEVKLGGTLPNHFKNKSGKGEKNAKEWIQDNMSGSSQIINLEQWTKKRYMGKDSHNPKKDLPEQWDKIEYRGVSENVTDIKGNTKYSALMYKVDRGSGGVTVSMKHPRYKKFMTWDNFLIFVMDKGLKPYHQQDIEAMQSKVDVISMEEDDDEPWKGGKNKGSITGFAPIDTHTNLDPLSSKLGWFVSRNNMIGAIKAKWHDMEHHRHHASDFRQKRMEYRLLHHKIGSTLGKIRPPIGHIFSEMEGEGDFWGLDEAITAQINHGKAELDAKVNASAKARQVLEVLEHGSHLTKPSRYQPDRERLRICGYLLWCLENGGPYNRNLKTISAKDGKRVAAILGKEHLELYKKNFDLRKLTREQNPNAENLHNLNMAEMDYIHRVIDSDEQQKLIFGSQFKTMIEAGYKFNTYKKGDNIQAGRDGAGAINEFHTLYEGMKNDNIGKDLFEKFMGQMRHGASLIKNGGFKTDQFNKRTGLLLGSMFSGRTLFRGDDFSQTHHFWKLGRDFGIHPITAQMLIDKKTGGSECIGHIFDKICETEGITPPFTKATKRDWSRLGPGIPHAERIAYINRFIQWWGQYADTIMPYMQLQNTSQPNKNLLQRQDDPHVANYVETFLREDKSPVDIDAKWHVDPTVFNYQYTSVWSFPKGMMVNQLLKFDSRGGFKGSAGEQNSSYFRAYLGKAIDKIGSANMNSHIYDFVMRKMFICFGEWFDGESKATFLNALRLLKLGGDKNIALAHKLLYTAVIINFQERLQGPMPGPVDEALRKFINFTVNHSHTYCSDDLISTVFHYDPDAGDNVEAYVSRADVKTQGLYTPAYYLHNHNLKPSEISYLKKQSEKNIQESLNKYEAKKSGMLTVNQADYELKEVLDARRTGDIPPTLQGAMQRNLDNLTPGPGPADIHGATHRDPDHIIQPTQHDIQSTMQTS